MKRLFLWLIGLFSSTGALAFDLDTLAAQLAEPDVIRGKFVQEKHLRGLAKPLLSDGIFTLSREYGLLWQLQRPIEQYYRISPDGIARWSAQSWQMQPKQTVAMRQSRLFLDVLIGDYRGLARDFSLELKGDATHWQIRLIPRSTLIGQIFDHIEIQGGALVERIELHETQGDHSVLRLLENTTDHALSETEQADFAAH